MYKVEFINDASVLPKAIETVKVRNSSSFGQWRCDLLVFENDKALFRVSCYGDSMEYQFTQEALIWLDWLVVGFGHQIYLYELKKDISKAVNLEVYFCKLHFKVDTLLVASARNIYALDKFGEILWISELLGIDGVVINEIENKTIFGEGEFDPPNGWKPFKISLDKGLVEWL